MAAFGASAGQLNDPWAPFLLHNIKLLAEECINQMLANITLENAAKLFYYSDLYELVDLKASVIEFICPNSIEVMKSEAWKEYVMKKPDLMEQLLVQLTKIAFLKL